MGTLEFMARVEKGDSLSGIARRYGIADWRTIYDLPVNAPLRRAFPDPNRIDFVSHDAARTPVHIYVPRSVQWKDQPITEHILNPQAIATPHRPSAPTQTERTVVKPEPGRLRHKAKFEVASEWKLKLEAKAPPLLPLNGAMPLAPVLWGVFHIRHELTIKPKPENAAKPIGLGASTITLDTYIRRLEPELVPVPVEVRPPVPEAAPSPGWWVTLRDASERGLTWTADAAKALLKHVGKALPYIEHALLAVVRVALSAVAALATAMILAAVVEAVMGIIFGGVVVAAPAGAVLAALGAVAFIIYKVSTEPLSTSAVPAS